MNSELYRLATFSSWSCPSYFASPLRLARIGFYYSGVGDRVICRACGKHCTGNDSALQHRCSEFSGHSLVHGTANDNIPLGLGSSLLPVGDMTSSGSIVSVTSVDMGIQAAADIPPWRLALSRGSGTSAGNDIGDGTLDSVGSVGEELRRLATFRSWLDTGVATVSPIQLARNGFSYSGEGDTIICCACGMFCTVGGYPLQRHGQQSPGCPFALGAASENFQLGQLSSPFGGGTSAHCFAQAESVRGDSVEVLRSVYLPALTRASRNGVFSANTCHDKQQKQEKVLVEKLRNNFSRYFFKNVRFRPDYLLGPNPSLGTTRNEVNDYISMSIIQFTFKRGIDETVVFPSVELGLQNLLK